MISKHVGSFIPIVCLSAGSIQLSCEPLKWLFLNAHSETWAGKSRLSEASHQQHFWRSNLKPEELYIQTPQIPLFSLNVFFCPLASLPWGHQRYKERKTVIFFCGHKSLRRFPSRVSIRVFMAHLHIRTSWWRDSITNSSLCLLLVWCRWGWKETTFWSSIYLLTWLKTWTNMQSWNLKQIPEVVSLFSFCSHPQKHNTAQSIYFKPG